MTRHSLVGFVCFLLLTAPAAAQSFRPQLEPTVKSVRSQYPTLVTPDQVGEILNAIAYKHQPNVKLLKKGGGENCPSPQGVDISCDILIWAPPGTSAEQTVHVDVLSGASGGELVPASAFWKSAGPCTKRPAGHPQGGSGCEMKNALAPIAPGGPIEPPPVPPTQPPPSSTDIEQRLRALEERVQRHVAP